MLLLSSLLGPAKPPVASREDVAGAPGVYIIKKLAGSLIARALQGGELMPIPGGERCLVCLCDYEPEEEVRQLSRCNHFFHRQCIDEVSQSTISILGPSSLTGLQWLTTGHNSCPLCRGKGVDEKSAPPSSSSTPRPRTRPRSNAQSAGSSL